MKVRTRLIALGIGALLVGAAVPRGWAQSSTLVLRFGSNPGNLLMRTYVPQGLPAHAPLVVALHGCLQTALAYDDETGWVALAQKRQFALLLPEQKPVNHFLGCFRWYSPAHAERNRGEALSIKQMIDKMKADHQIDPQRIYVTGLSAGGAMTAVMLATYPELFAGGAIIAGVPYRCANGPFTASDCMRPPGKNRTPGQWGQWVRNASPHTGPWPKVSIWQGTKDSVVVSMNAQELVEQWTAVHQIDPTPDGQDTVNGHPHEVYKDSDGTVRVERYLITHLGHGTPIAPGQGEEHCGTPSDFILDAGICSSFHIAKFWGLIGQ